MTELTIDQAAALAPTVTPAEAWQRVSAGAVLIDVRSDAGRAANGEIPDATVVAKDQVAARFDLDAADRVPGVTGLDVPIVVVCGSVLGSGPVAAALIARGFRDVVQVAGGFPAWQSAGLPTAAPVAG